MQQHPKTARTGGGNAPNFFFPFRRCLLRFPLSHADSPLFSFFFLSLFFFSSSSSTKYLVLPRDSFPPSWPLCHPTNPDPVQSVELVYFDSIRVAFRSYSSPAFFSPRNVRMHPLSAPLVTVASPQPRRASELVFVLQWLQLKLSGCV